MMKPHSDDQHIQALRQGDFAVLDKIYREHATPMRQWILKNNGTSADAQDIFQEAIIVIHQKANDPAFVLTCPLGALLFSIGKNKWLNQLRKKNREAEVRSWEETRYKEEGALTSTLEAVEEETIRQGKLDATFKQLSELCQKLLRLLVSGISSADVAVQLGMNDANTVYRRKNACVERWRTLYQTLEF